jgi:hypothetical protein
MATVTITFETYDSPRDGRAPLTWDKLREIIAQNTPAAGHLEVRRPIEALDRENVWGKLHVEVSLSTSDRVADALRYNTALIVDTDPGVVVLAGQELAQAWDELAPGEGFVILGSTKNLASSPAAQAIEAAAQQWTSDQYPGFVFSDYLKGQVSVIANAFDNLIFPEGTDPKIKDDAISALIRARVALHERLAQVEVAS